MVEGLPEDNIPMFLDTFFELLLQETTAVLVLAHGRYLADQVLKPTSGIAVIYRLFGKQTSYTSKGAPYIHGRSLLSCCVSFHGTRSFSLPGLDHGLQP